MKRHFHYQKGNVSKYSRKREGFEMSDMSNVFILDHPLIQHKISRLRDENTGTNEFRKLIEEIAMLMGYEALRDLPMEDVEIKTPIETCKTPMLATGGSGSEAVDFIKQHGGKNIKFMCIIAAPEGLERLRKDHPDIQIYVGHLDRCLNDHAYICPGLGDAGDRIFGTK